MSDSVGSQFVVPEGWLLDDVTRERMTRRLAAAPGHVAGIVAEPRELPPGSSYRVHAERLSMEPETAIVELIPEPGEPLVTRGAALLRDGVAFDTDEGALRVRGGSLVVDHGTFVHDPWRPIGAPRTASVLGRPPFPWRPVVAFLGYSFDNDDGDWSRRLANALLARDVEGRVVTAGAADGYHLTKPCRPDPASIEALDPDVIVALGPRALELAHEWNAANRGTVVIEATQEQTADIELVSWRIGRARGRVRARIGLDVKAAALAEVVQRLVAGPHPAPPRDDFVPVTVTMSATPRDTTPPSVAIVTGVLDDAATRRINGLVDHVQAYGATAHILDADGDLRRARTADVVVLRAVTATEQLDDLLARRQRDGRVTLVDVGWADVRAVAEDDNALALAPAAWAATRACGWATTPSDRVRQLLHDNGIRALTIPTFTSRVRVNELTAARDARTETFVLGWHVGALPARAPADHTNMADMFVQLLSDRPGLQLELAGAPSRMPEPLLHHRRVTVRPGEPDLHILASWRLQCWTPDPVAADVNGDVRPAVDGGFLGVPTLVAAENPAAATGIVPPELAISGADKPSAWLRVVERLLDDGQEHARRAQEVRRRAESLEGSATAATVVARLLGAVTNGRTS
jgi:hypothetical protein